MELTIYQVKNRLEIGTREAMQLYRNGDFPGAVSGREAKDVKIPIEDIEAYEKRISGADATDELGKIEYELAQIRMAAAGGPAAGPLKPLGPDQPGT